MSRIDRLIIKSYTKFIYEGYGTELAKKLTKKELGFQSKVINLVIRGHKEIRQMISERYAARRMGLR